MILDIKDFRGLNTGIAAPPSNSAIATSNFTRSKKRGSLQLTDGYAAVLTPLPTNNTVHKITNFQIIDAHNFNVPDHGGQQITALVAQYTLTGYYTGNPSINRFGIWLSHWWNGAAWVQQWTELTEMFIFTMFSESGNVLTIDDGTFNFSGIDPVNTFNTTHFQDWILVFDDAATYGFGPTNDNNNYLLVTACGYSGANYNLTYFGDPAHPTGRSANSKLYAYRNIYQQELPSSLKSYVYGLLGGIRMTTGSATYGSGDLRNDLAIMAGFRTTNWGWNSPSGNVMDRFISEPACPKIWSKAVAASVPTLSLDVDPLPAGTYYLKQSVQFDDGNETIPEAIYPLTSVPAMNQYAQLPMSGASGGAIVSDGTHLYFATHDSPSVVFKIDPVNKVVISSLSLTGYNNCTALVMEGGILYAGVAGPTILKINTADMSLVANLSLTGAASAANTIGLCSDGNYLYATVDSDPGAVMKVAIATFSQIAIFTVAAGNAFTAASMIGTDGVLYIGVLGGVNCLIQIDPASLTQLWLLPGADAITALTMNQANIYAGTGTSPAKLLEIDPTVPMIVHSLVLAAGENICYSIVYQGGYIYATTSTAPARIIQATPIAEVLSFALLAGFNYAKSLLSFQGAFIVLTDTSPPYLGFVNYSAYAQGAVDGTQAINIEPKISPSMLPKRARYLNIYMSADTVTWFMVKQVGLYQGENSWSNNPAYDTNLYHNYIQMTNPVTVHGSDWNNGIEASVQLGRDPADAGIAQYVMGITNGELQYVVGLRYNGVFFPNDVFVSTTNGQGEPCWDTFPNDNNHRIDLEYSDGDALVGIAPINDMLLAMKNLHTIILIGPDQNGGYQRQVVSEKEGILNPHAFSVDNNTIYMAGETAIVAFSLSNLRVINAEWLQDWQALNKVGTFVTLDQKNRLCRIVVGQSVYNYSLDDNEWMVDSLPVTPLAFSLESDGTIDLATTSALFHGDPTKQFNGTAVTATWESNRQELPAEQGPELDMVLQNGFIYLDSPAAAVTISIYLDDNVAPIFSEAIPPGTTYFPFWTPLACRCKAFHIKLSATTSADGQSVEISEAALYYQLEPAYGDILIQ